MSIGLESIDHTVQLTHAWINDLDSQLRWNEEHKPSRVLAAVLHALRDGLPINEAADLAAQLPTHLRGVYYEQWRPATVPVKKRSKADFLARVNAAFANDPPPEPEFTVTAALRPPSDQNTLGEISDVREALPADLRALWPMGTKHGRKTVAS